MTIGTGSVGLIFVVRWVTMILSVIDTSVGLDLVVVRKSGDLKETTTIRIRRFGWRDNCHFSVRLPTPRKATPCFVLPISGFVVLSDLSPFQLGS